MKVMLGQIMPSAAQLKAATTLFRKKIEGVKEEDAEKAKKAATGNFASNPAPLTMVNL